MLRIRAFQEADVWRDNREAIAFYRKVGFAEDAVLSMGKRLERDD
jgi:ribosomal protein S18 acetylase RimI-like enzyme